VNAGYPGLYDWAGVIETMLTIEHRGPLPHPRELKERPAIFDARVALNQSRLCTARLGSLGCWLHIRPKAPASSAAHPQREAKSIRMFVAEMTLVRHPRIGVAYSGTPDDPHRIIV
jgi:hypothetical protein